MAGGENLSSVRSVGPAGAAAFSPPPPNQPPNQPPPLPPPLLPALLLPPPLLLGSGVAGRVGDAFNTGLGRLPPTAGAAATWPGMSIGGGAIGGAVTRVSRMPSPSIIARSTPPNAADRPADFRPVRSCSTPPVSAPDAMLFQGSSFLRTATKVQSKAENSPPQTANPPPIRGASRLIACEFSFPSASV